MIRAHGGNDEHPNALVFIQLYRLLGSYSLIRSCKGSNVTSAETMKTLLEIRDLKLNGNPQDGRKHWYFLLDRVIDEGVDISEVDLFKDPMEALEYFAGYVARKGMNFTKCELCIETLRTSPEKPENLTYLNCRNFCGGLILPSEVGVSS